MSASSKGGEGWSVVAEFDDATTDVHFVEKALDALDYCLFEECDDPTVEGTSYCALHLGWMRRKAIADMDRDELPAPSPEQVDSQITQIGKAARELVRIANEKFDAEKAAREYVEQTITSLIGKPDPNGKAGKLHTLTSAEVFAKASEQYREFKETIHQCEQALVMANGAYEEVKLRARLSVALVSVGEFA